MASADHFFRVRLPLDLQGQERKDRKELGRKPTRDPDLTGWSAAGYELSIPSKDPHDPRSPCRPACCGVAARRPDPQCKKRR